MSFVFFIINYTTSYTVITYIPKDTCVQVHAHTQSVCNKKKKNPKTQHTFFVISHYLPLI